jgi:hypothetical protein
MAEARTDDHIKYIKILVGYFKLPGHFTHLRHLEAEPGV